LKFPELQPSDFPAWCKSTLKRFCSISDVDRCKPQGNGDVANLRTLDLENSARLASRLLFSACNSAKFLAKTESAAHVPMVVWLHRFWTPGRGQNSCQKRSLCLRHLG
jgi:hypothetical protein